MRSSILVIALWAFCLETLGEKHSEELLPKENSLETWGLSFCLALSVLFISTFLQINLIKGLSWLRLITFAEIAFSLIYLLYAIHPE